MRLVFACEQSSGSTVEVITTEMIADTVIDKLKKLLDSDSKDGIAILSTEAIEFPELSVRLPVKVIPGGLRDRLISRDLSCDCLLKGFYQLESGDKSYERRALLADLFAMSGYVALTLVLLGLLYVAVQ